ncbi:DUF6327 family protein [Poritiphilus flavus]|uniref:DUF6327 family protein n=1 Tax=Poritiphilus flavus TaxID=2697053 RepID=UPI001EEB333C|nr:DUF6327 family protein [Poritiphilus flavus]
MAPITYNNFEEIDQRLEILRLQREISKENLKYNLHHAKSNFYPTQLVGGLSGAVQKMALVYAIRFLSRIFRKRDKVKVLD